MPGPLPELVKAFPECPWCGSTETCTELAIKHLELREKGFVKEGMLISSSKIIIPLYNPMVAVLTVPHLLQEIDGCGECGRNRVIRVSTIDVPVTAMKPAGQG